MNGEVTTLQYIIAVILSIAGLPLLKWMWGGVRRISKRSGYYAIVFFIYIFIIGALTLQLSQMIENFGSM